MMGTSACLQTPHPPIFLRVSRRCHLCAALSSLMALVSSLDCCGRTGCQVPTAAVGMLRCYRGHSAVSCCCPRKAVLSFLQSCACWSGSQLCVSVQLPNGDNGRIWAVFSINHRIRILSAVSYFLKNNYFYYSNFQCRIIIVSKMTIKFHLIFPATAGPCFFFWETCGFQRFST